MRRVIDQLHMAEVQIAYGMTETSPVSLQTGQRMSWSYALPPLAARSHSWKTSWWTLTAASFRAARSANYVPAATA